MIVDLVVGARPNYMKAAAIYHAWQEAAVQAKMPFTFRIIDTGQHHLPAMSGEIGTRLGLPQPHVHLNAGGVSTTELTATILLRYGALLKSAPPAATVVVGDVTSTLAAALAARQAGIFLVHVEAGLRSGDPTMPEEHNRILTDVMSNLLLVTSNTAAQHLVREGIGADKIVLVGNTMIDTLCRQLPHAQKPLFWEEKQLQQEAYLLLTMHRPGNVDTGEHFLARLQIIATAAAPLKVVFPLHPRTAAYLEGRALPPNIILVPPQDYHSFLYLLQHARGLITDSGGASEEAAFLGKRCLVMRTTTERPETLTCGSAVLIGEDNHLLQQEINHLQHKESLPIAPVPLWDGFAGRRIIEALKAMLLSK